MEMEGENWEGISWFKKQGYFSLSMALDDSDFVNNYEA